MELRESVRGARALLEAVGGKGGEPLPWKTRPGMGKGRRPLRHRKGAAYPSLVWSREASTPNGASFSRR